MHAQPLRNGGDGRFLGKPQGGLRDPWGSLSKGACCLRAQASTQFVKNAESGEDTYLPASGRMYAALCSGGHFILLAAQCSPGAEGQPPGDGWLYDSLEQWTAAQPTIQAAITRGWRALTRLVNCQLEGARLPLPDWPETPKKGPGCVQQTDGDNNCGLWIIANALKHEGLLPNYPAPDSTDDVRKAYGNSFRQQVLAAVQGVAPLVSAFLPAGAAGLPQRTSSGGFCMDKPSFALQYTALASLHAPGPKKKQCRLPLQVALVASNAPADGAGTPAAFTATAPIDGGQVGVLALWQAWSVCLDVLTPCAHCAVCVQAVPLPTQPRVEGGTKKRMDEGAAGDLSDSAPAAEVGQQGADGMHGRGRHIL